MGHRANYVIVENGQVELFFSRWGATSIVADMLAGPALATAAIRPVAERTPPPEDDLPGRAGAGRSGTATSARSWPPAAAG